MRRSFTIALCLLLIPLISRSLLAAPIAPPAETPEQLNARMHWWRSARFGMFIHWDMSSVAGTEISWSRKSTRPLDIGKPGDPAGYVEDPVYDHLYEKFNPVNFDAKKWVALAQAAGAKYIVFTAKHHGGFCMWDTKLTDYNIMHSPFKRDVVGELAAACHAAGMRFGIYYSPRDWHNPDYGIGDNAKYLAYMNGQIRELLTNYGQVDVIWFDSYGKGDLLNFWHADETLSLIKSLQPNIVINNRLAILGRYSLTPAPYNGDFDTPEQRLGKFQSGRAWETCMSIVSAPSGGWSYRPDGKVRSLDVCIKALATCAVGDGNLLLDAGPNPLGEIPTDQAERYTQIGQWLTVNGESIYDTRGGPYISGPWGGSTYRGNIVYLHIFASADDTVSLVPLPQKVTDWKVLSGSDAQVAQTPAGIAVTFTAPRKPAADTVIKLTLDQPVSGILKGSALAKPQ